MASFFSWISEPGSSLFGTVPSTALLLLAISVVLSAIGFIRQVYFISIGYGLSVFGIAVAALVVYRAHLDSWVIIQGGLLALYGLRLSAYLAARERQAAFRDERQAASDQRLGASFLLTPAIWISVALLYVVMCSPFLFHLEWLSANAAPTTSRASLSALVPIGLAVCALGLATESVADLQKARFKRRSPNAFCPIGLFRIVRCPNYLGEILVWLGGWIAGAPFYPDWSAWIVSLAGLTLIVLIMLGSAKRLEEKQAARYGNQDAYHDYASCVPVLLPLVPIYSLRGLKVYLG